MFGPDHRVCQLRRQPFGFREAILHMSDLHGSKTAPRIILTAPRQYAANVAAVRDEIFAVCGAITAFSTSLALVGQPLNNQPTVDSCANGRGVPDANVPTGNDLLSNCPAEIRNSIFQYALELHMVFDLTTYRPIGGIKPRRAVQASFVDHARHEGLVFDHASSKWRGLSPSTTFALACTNRQTAKETLPMLYGDNTFEFHTLGCMNIFLRNIGTMRDHVRHIAITGRKAYLFTKPTLAFRDLSLCPALQQFSFDCDSMFDGVGQRRIGPQVAPEQFVRDITDFLRAWHESHKDEQGHSNVLDVVKLTRTCSRCVQPYYRPDSRRPCGPHGWRRTMDQVATLLAQALA